VSLSPSFALALLALLTVAYCLVDVTDLARVTPLAAIAVGCAVLSRTRARTLLSRLLPLGTFVLVAAVLVLLAPVQPGRPRCMWRIGLGPCRLGLSRSSWLWP